MQCPLWHVASSGPQLKGLSTSGSRGWGRRVSDGCRVVAASGGRGVTGASATDGMELTSGTGSSVDEVPLMSGRGLSSLGPTLPRQALPAPLKSTPCGPRHPSLALPPPFHAPPLPSDPAVCETQAWAPGTPPAPTGHLCPRQPLTTVEFIRHVPAVRPPVTAVLQGHTLIVAVAGKLSLGADPWELGHCGGGREPEAQVQGCCRFWHSTGATWL